MTRPLVFLAAAVLLVAAIMLAGGCSEKDVPYVIDNEIIMQYMANSPDARDLFRSDSLVLPDEFTVPQDSAVYKFVVDSTRRYTYLDIRVDTVMYNSVTGYYRIRHIYPTFGEIWGDGEVTVNDYFYSHLLRIVGSDTTARPVNLALTRYGYFLKLGNDNQPYRGWKLWAINAGEPSTGLTTITAGTDTTFYGDLRDYATIKYTVSWKNLTTGEEREYAGQSKHLFERLDRLATLPGGLPFYLNCTSVPSTSYFRLAAALTNAGMTQSVMDRVSSSTYVDTIQTATSSGYLWNLLFFHDVYRSQEPNSDPPIYTYSWKGWSVPYRTQQ